MAKKRIFLALATAIITSSVYAQYSNDYSARGLTEIGIQGGFTGYRGDLGGTLGAGSNDLKDFDQRLPNLMVAADATITANRWLSIRPNIAVMQILGDDKSLSSGSVNDRGRFYRNLSFKSMVYEAAVLAEVNPFYIFNKYAEKEEHRFHPYGAVGLGVFHFNPKGNLNGKWHELQPLSTEGQGMAEYPDRKIYRRVQLNIPVGFGFKYYLTPTFYGGLEFLYRKTFTDYLDDVSKTYITPELFYEYFEPSKAELARQLSYRSLNNPTYQAGAKRGNPDTKDGYYTFGLRVGVVLGGLE